jgi:hypothetical protein
MKVFFKSRVFEWWIGLCSIYWVFGWIPQRQALSTCLTGLLFSTWLGLTITWWRGAWVSIHDPESTLGGRVIMVGFAGLATGVSGIFCWSLLFQYLGQPDWMRYHPVRGQFLWMIFISGMALQFVAYTDGNTVLPARFGKLGAVVALVTSGAILLGYLSGGFAE